MSNVTKSRCREEDDDELRRGPWTLEEDTLLIHYVTCHGEGRWNMLAKCSGLKRTGKSCRLRWLNYLKPDVKHGNLTPEEQLLILDLHSKWGNRWSRIAQHLPGRTDNEIKNYWRTRVKKQARLLNIDANSTRFQDAIHCLWIPRLLQKNESSSSSIQNLNSTPFLLNNGPQTQSVQSLSTSEVNRASKMICFEKYMNEDCSSSITSDSMNMTQLTETSKIPTSPQFFESIDYDTFYDMGALNPTSTSAIGVNYPVFENSWDDGMEDYGLWR